MTLVGFQDDATSQVLAARFQIEPENTIGYLHILAAMLRTQGIPLSLYRDQHSTFQRNNSHWRLEEELARRQDPAHLGRRWKNSAFSKSPRSLRRPKGASSAVGALFKTG